MLAFAYPIRFSDYTASVTIAMTTHSERDNAAADKAKIAVINTESCIAEWRIALRQRSARYATRVLVDARERNTLNLNQSDAIP